MSILCPDHDQLSLYGDITLSNYTSVTVDFEYCFESNLREDCYEDEEVIESISNGKVYFIVQLEYQQLNMKNFTHPLQHIIKAFTLQLQPLTRELQTISLSPNSFEDSHDWLGFQSENVAAQDFLTIDTEKHTYEPQTTKKKGDVQFQLENYPAPSTKLTV